MEVRLRQRIIGGVVLAALAIIFLPLLFKGSNNENTEPKQVTLSAEIPPAPAKPAATPQTIVMIQNKDLNTPDDASQNTMAPSSNSMTNPVSSDHAPTVQPVAAIKDSTNAALSPANANPPSNQSTMMNNTTGLAAVSNKPTSVSSAPSSVIENNQANNNIDAIEDKTLSPTASTKSTSGNLNAKPQLGSTKSTLAAANTTAPKPIKKSEKLTDAKHASKTATKSTATAKPSLAKSNADTTLIPNTTTTKKHSSLNQTKLADASAKQATTTHKKAPGTTNNTTQSLNTTASAATPASTGVAWIVRLGSFANESNAKELVTQLRTHGFKAYTQPVQTSLGKLTRVAIGPEVKRAKADAINTRLNKEMNIKGEVVPFSPVTENT